MGALFGFVAILGTLCALMAAWLLCKGVWWVIRALHLPELLLAGLYWAAEGWDKLTVFCGKAFDGLRRICRELDWRLNR